MTFKPEAAVIRQLQDEISRLRKQVTSGRIGDLQSDLCLFSRMAPTGREPCCVQRQFVDCDLSELRPDKFAFVTNPCNIPEKHSLNCSSKYFSLYLRNLILSRFCFNKEFKQATKISSTQ